MKYGRVLKSWSGTPSFLLTVLTERKRKPSCIIITEGIFTTWSKMLTRVRLLPHTDGK